MDPLTAPLEFAIALESGLVGQSAVDHYWLSADYWDLSIPLYLFLAVVAGGGVLTGATAPVLARLLGSADGRLEGELARWGFLVGVVSAAGAGLAVLSHLAVILRAVLFPIYLTNFESWITIGTWILVGLSVIATICLVFRLFGAKAAAAEGASLFPRAIVGKLGLLELADRLVDRFRPPAVVMGGLYAAGSLLAIATIYTGFELSIVETVPLWNMPVAVPLAFLFSGLAAGIGLTVGLTLVFERRLEPIIGAYAAMVGLLSGLGLAAVWYGWSVLTASDAPAAAASQVALTNGTLAAGSWLVVFGLAVASVVGLLVGALALTGRSGDGTDRLAGPALIGSFGLLLLGSLALRIILLLAAEQNPVVVVG